MKIVVDKRTELMSIVLALSQGNEYIKEHFSFDFKEQYRDEVKIYFYKYKDHRCIDLARKIAQNEEGFNFDNPIRLAFALNEDLQFSGKIEAFLLEELENEKLLKDFMKEISNFAKESKFNEFYDKQKDYYLSKIKEVENLLNKEKFLNELKVFFKRDITEQFCINIIPMLTNSNHGFTISKITYANIGLLSEDNKSIESFNNGYKHIIIHEFCHSFVNSYTQLQSLSIPEQIKMKIKNIGYKNSITYLNETIVRALTIRLREKLDNLDKIYIQRFLNRERGLGFIYIENCYQELLNYEKQSNSWGKYFQNFIKNFKNMLYCKN